MPKLAEAGASNCSLPAYGGLPRNAVWLSHKHIHNCEEMMSESEFDTEHGQGGRTDREVKQSVPCTAVHQIAEWLRDAEAIIAACSNSDNAVYIATVACQRESKRRLLAIMDAINETRCEGGMPNA
jgi:hypothetical protein